MNAIQFTEVTRSDCHRQIQISLEENVNRQCINQSRKPTRDSGFKCNLSKQTCPERVDETREEFCRDITIG